MVLNSCKKQVIIESVFLLLKNPILFVPKLFVAFLYGWGMLFSASLLKQMYYLYSAQSQVVLSEINSFFISAFLLFALTIFTFFVDLFFSGIYPPAVLSAQKEKIDFKNIIFSAKKRILLLFVSGIILWLLITVVSMASSVVIVFFGLNSYSVYLSFGISFAFIFIFYFIFPEVIFGTGRVKGVFTDSVKKSFQNKKKVFVYSLIPFSVSVLKFFVAFSAESFEGMVIFWALVLVTGLVYSIHAVANQILYSSL